MKSGNLLRLFLFIWSLTILVGCDPKPDVSVEPTQNQSADVQVDNPLDESEVVAPLDWDPYIESFDQGWISSTQPISIRFQHAVVASNKVNTPLTGVVKVTPDITFDQRFIADNELLITPETKLPAGQKYQISLSAKHLDNVAKQLPPLVFQVQVLEQDLELNVSGLEQGRHKSVMDLSGTLRTQDTVDNSAVEKVLQGTQGGQPLDITWQHQTDQRLHRFSIKNIARAEEVGKIMLQWNGQPIGVNKQGIHEVEVPGLNQFAVTAVRSHNKPRQSLEISFSEPLKSGQNTRGLVRLNGENVNARIDGSKLKIYPSNQLSGEYTLDVEDTIRSVNNLTLAQTHTAQVVFISELPGVRYIGKGSILPPNKTITVPFEAINVDAVWVTAFKVFDNNIGQFLQGNDIASSSTNVYTGRYLWRKKITLPSVPQDKWQNYSLDLAKLMANHSDGIVNIKLSIDPSVSRYPCEKKIRGPVNQDKNYDGPGNEEEDLRPEWIEKYYGTENGYISWRKRNDPCDEAFYHYNDQTHASRNFFLSDFGLIAKKGADSDLHVIVTSITTGLPQKNVTLTAYNFQQQAIASGKTDDNGQAKLALKGKPFYLEATNQSGRGYLKLATNEALPTSQFDVGGVMLNKGIKGFIYGERDVWRPGDDIYLNFILQDKKDQIPAGHPVSMDLFDAKGTLIASLTNGQPVGNIYTFHFATQEDAPTGSWRAIVKVGGSYFDKVIKVETIQPNRLKIDFKMADSPIQLGNEQLQAEIYAQWLSGATAKALQADTELSITSKKTVFDGFSQYIFDDPASRFEKSKKQIFSGSLNEEGKKQFQFNLGLNQSAPGKLRATFISRVFEKSGNFSTSIHQDEILPFANWVGLYIPEGSGYRNAIDKHADHPVRLVSINSESQPVANRQLRIKVYKLNWYWWWDKPEENLANYIRGRHASTESDVTVTTDENGTANWILKKDSYSWGRYLIRVCDVEGNHCSGKQVYMGWSWNNQVSPDAATQLMLSTDKAKYEVGDQARIQLPDINQGKVFYSIENGSEVIDQQWVQVSEETSAFTLPITAAMAPNVYLNVSLILPHQNKTSDAPIRLYGVVPLLVENAQNRVKPEIVSPESVRPESQFTVEVKEADGKAMAYTLAVVDEGLLGITNYSAPDPYDYFYQKEALGVRTWDIFDGVIGAYGANLERTLRIGGGKSQDDKKESKQRRFPPVVRFLGAFKLQKGEVNRHQIDLPQYMGAVRVMVVAATDTAFGVQEKTVKVTQPLTLLTTLPRVLGPGEKVAMPVNVFVSDKSIQQVDVTAKTDSPLSLTTSTAQLLFNEPGDQIALLNLQVDDSLGQGQVNVVARSGQETAEQTIAIESRSANLAQTQSVTKLLPPGETWQPALIPNGMVGTNQASLTASSLPAMNLRDRLDYLIRYPHGCVEQTTSAVFPQIWLHQLTTLSDDKRGDIQYNVEEALKKYKRFQHDNGGFSYWPSATYVNDWASSYVTHFLVEAKNQGYPVEITMLNSALSYLKQKSDESGDSRNLYSVMAYRLYVLAEAGKPNLPAMNRLRERLLKNAKQNTLNHEHNLASWLLAIGYNSLGLADVAEELMSISDTNIQDYRYSEYTYGSSLRDLAVLNLAYSRLKKQDSAWLTAKSIAKQLSSDNWYSTQTTSWALLALAHFSDIRTGDSSRFSIHDQPSNRSDWKEMEFSSSFYQQAITQDSLNNQRLQIRNDSEHPIYFSLSNTGIPKTEQEEAVEQGLKLDVQFFDLNQQPIDIASLPQGQDFIAEVTVSAITKMNSFQYQDIALTMVMPSGWQIRNQRLEGESLPQGLDYQDIRDDRISSYFSLWRNHYWRYRYNNNSQPKVSIKVQLNATYAGRFYLPSWQVESMYDNELQARSMGKWVEVKQQ
ncbi:MG2 domain-containing protein [Teredinibacter sp. KSP-S5-2]|uniref:MG2 domain-containing protein n=1 Tax=Teredinibacter sp. KSP-S5-2 TaxID=3034506 RepID=UPI0029348D89|nr:MG2 domain-containing protein [Teredinibacter sp. KSP-S5-2]WNO08642.1 MG2 domain-containing protein [Teredinibacter sp. KSP-S5-2]